jgi:sugar lactone lactonase YvrE
MPHASWLRTRVAIRTVAIAIVLILSSTVAAAADPRDHASSEGKLLVRGAPIHGANGIFFDKYDRLHIASFLGREIVVMDPRTGAILDRLGLPKIDVGTPDDLIFGPDGSLYWTSPVSGEVNRLSATGVRTTQVVGPGVNPITFSDDGRLFVSECFIGDVLFELDPNLVLPPRVIRSDLGPGCGLNGMDWFGGFLYGPRWFTGEVVRVNVDSGEVTTVASGFGTPSAVKFDSHGRLHVPDSQSGQVVRVNMENGGKTVITQLTPGLDNLAFDSQDRLFVSGDLDGFIIQVLSGGRTRTVRKGGMISPGGVAVLPGQGRRETVFVADAFSLRAFDGRTGRPESTTPGEFPVPALKGPFTVSPDGYHWSSPHQLVLSSYFDNVVQV